MENIIYKTEKFTIKEVVTKLMGTYYHLAEKYYHEDGEVGYTCKNFDTLDEAMTYIVTGKNKNEYDGSCDTLKAYMGE